MRRRKQHNSAYTTTAGLDLDTVWILADLNGDYDVDNDDVSVISNNIGLTNADWEDGDLDDDGTVDSDDVDLAFVQYGLDLAVVI